MCLLNNMLGKTRKSIAILNCHESMRSGRVDCGRNRGNLSVSLTHWPKHRHYPFVQLFNESDFFWVGLLVGPRVIDLTPGLEFLDIFDSLILRIFNLFILLGITGIIGVIGINSVQRRVSRLFRRRPHVCGEIWKVLEYSGTEDEKVEKVSWVWQNSNLHYSSIKTARSPNLYILLPSLLGINEARVPCLQTPLLIGVQDMPSWSKTIHAHQEVTRRQEILVECSAHLLQGKELLVKNPKPPLRRRYYLRKCFLRRRWLSSREWLPNYIPWKVKRYIQRVAGRVAGNKTRGRQHFASPVSGQEVK